MSEERVRRQTGAQVITLRFADIPIWKWSNIHIIHTSALHPGRGLMLASRTSLPAQKKRRKQVNTVDLVFVCSRLRGPNENGRIPVSMDAIRY